MFRVDRSQSVYLRKWVRRVYELLTGTLGYNYRANRFGREIVKTPCELRDTKDRDLDQNIIG